MYYDEGEEAFVCPTTISVITGTSPINKYWITINHFQCSELLDYFKINFVNMEYLHVNNDYYIEVYGDNGFSIFNEKIFELPINSDLEKNLKKIIELRIFR